MKRNGGTLGMLRDNLEVSWRERWGWCCVKGVLNIQQPLDGVKMQTLMLLFKMFKKYYKSVLWG